MTESKPSKSALKRQFIELQALGESLIELTDTQLSAVVTDPQLIDAVRRARSMGSHGALRRQKQFIGKLMREIDAEPIRVAIDALGRRMQEDKRVFREAEAWRERLCGEEKASLAEFAAFTGSSNPALQQLVRQHASTNLEMAKKALSRQIFREIHKELTVKVQSSAAKR